MSFLVLLKCCCCIDNYQQIIVCLMTFIQMVDSYTRSILKLLLVDFLLHEHSGSPKQPNQMCQVKETNWKLNKFASKRSLNKKKKNCLKLFVKDCSGTKSDRCLTINDKTMHLEKVIQSLVWSGTKVKQCLAINDKTMQLEKVIQSLVWSGTKVEQCLAINRVSEIKREHSHFLVRGRIGENHLKHWKWKIKKEKF